MTEPGNAGSEPMTGVRVRIAGPEHAGEILTVQRAAFVAEARRYGTAELPPLTETLDDVRRHLASGVTVGAWRAERLVGAARLTVDIPTGWISRVAVAPDLQGHGIGSRLLEELEAVAPPEVAQFRLAAGPRSEDNLAFYARRGYRDVARQLDALGIPLVVMAKDRPAARSR